MAYTVEQLKLMLAENRWKRYRERDLSIKVGETTHTVRVLTRAITNVPREDLDAMKAAMTSYTSAKNDWGTATNSVENPLVDEKEQAGTWYAGLVEVRKEALQEEGRPTWNLYQTLYSGAVATAYYAVENSCRYTVEHKRHVAVGGMITLPSNADGITYSIAAENYDPDSGGWNIIEIKRTRKYQEIAAYTSDLRADYVESTTRQEGVTTQGLTSMAEEAGKTKSQRKQKDDDCTVTADTSVRTHADQTVTETLLTPREKRVTTIHTQATAAAAEPASISDVTEGTYKRVRNRPTEVPSRTETTVEEGTATSRRWSYTFATRAGTVSVWRGVNATSTEFTTDIGLASLTSTPGYENHVEKEESPEYKDRWNYTIIKRPVINSTTYADSDWENFGEERLQLVDPEGRAYNVVKVWTSSPSKAIGYAHGTWTSSGSYGQTATGYVKTGAYGGHRTDRFGLGLGRWLGVRVELSKTAFGIP